MTQSKDSLLKSYNNRLKEDVKSMLENFEGKNKLILNMTFNLIDPESFQRS